MAKIVMLETKKGSPDGLVVLRYDKGITYDIPEGLANVFIKEGWAEIDAPKPASVVEKKMAPSVPENKMAKAVVAEVKTPRPISDEEENTQEEVTAPRSRRG